MSNAIIAHNLSYTALAKILGVSQATVSDKMRGKIKFTAKDVAILVEFFKLSAEYLFKRDDGLPTLTPSKAERYAKRSVAQRGATPYKNLLAEIDKRQLTYGKLAKMLILERTTVFAKMCGKIRFTERDKAKLEEIFGLPAEYLLAI